MDTKETKFISFYKHDDVLYIDYVYEIMENDNSDLLGAFDRIKEKINSGDIKNFTNMIRKILTECSIFIVGFELISCSPENYQLYDINTVLSLPIIKE